LLSGSSGLLVEDICLWSQLPGERVCIFVIPLPGENLTGNFTTDVYGRFDYLSTVC